MKILTDAGTEVDIAELSFMNVRPGDMIVYRPAVPVTRDNCVQLMNVVDFLEKNFQGVHVLMIPQKDVIEVVREG